MRTSEFKVGMDILVETGCVQLGNIKWSKQTISGIARIGKNSLEVSFVSGLVCRYRDKAIVTAYSH